LRSCAAKPHGSPKLLTNAEQTDSLPFRRRLSVCSWEPIIPKGKLLKTKGRSMEPETTEIQMREEDGVRTYSVVRVYRGDGECGICRQNVPEVAELSCTDIYDDDASRTATLDICEGCAYRVGALFAPHNAGKELFCGVLQAAD